MYFDLTCLQRLRGYSKYSVFRVYFYSWFSLFRDTTVNISTILRHLALGEIIIIARWLANIYSNLLKWNSKITCTSNNITIWANVSDIFYSHISIFNTRRSHYKELIVSGTTVEYMACRLNQIHRKILQFVFAVFELSLVDINTKHT